MRTLFIIILLTFLCGLFSCNNENAACFKSTGDLKIYSETLGYFDRISIESNFDVKLKQSATHSIKITAGKNLIPHVDFTIIGRELRVENKNRCNWLRDYNQIEIEISFPDLKHLYINEACDISTIDTLKLSWIRIDNYAGIIGADLHIESDTIRFHSHASTGDIRLSGKADFVYLYSRGNNYIFARNLDCNVMQLVHRSLGNTEILVRNLLMIEVIEHGSVYSYACPTIDSPNPESMKNFINLGCPQ